MEKTRDERIFEQLDNIEDEIRRLRLLFWFTTKSERRWLVKVMTELVDQDKYGLNGGMSDEDYGHLKINKRDKFIPNFSRETRRS